MVRKEKLKLDPGQDLLFQPGGYHLMLIQPQKTFTTGERVPLTLQFANGLRLVVEFEVRSEQFNL